MKGNTNKYNLQHPATLKDIAAKAAAGIPGAEIARDLGVHKSTISRRLSTPELQKMVEEERQAFLQAVPHARRNITNLVEQHDNLDADSKDKQRAWASSMEMLRAAGMLPSHTMSQTINNIYNDNSTQLLVPEVSAFLDQFAAGMALEDDSDVIDVEKVGGNVDLSAHNDPENEGN